MKRRSGTVLLLAAALALGTLLLWALSSKAPEREPVAQGEEAHASAPGASGGTLAPAPRSLEGPVAVEEADGVSRIEQPSVSSEPASLLVIQGVVIDELGEPTWIAEVFLTDLSEQEASPDSPPALKTKTNAAGTFEFEGMRPGPYALVAQGRRGETSPFEFVVLDGSHPTTAVTLRISNLPPISGVVLDEGSRPLHGVKVFAFVDWQSAAEGLLADLRSSPLTRPRPEYSDSDGAFSIRPRVHGVSYSIRAEYKVPQERFSPVTGTPQGIPPGEMWLARAEGVRPGSAPLTLIVQPLTQDRPRLFIDLRPTNGGRLPQELRFRLRELDGGGNLIQEHIGPAPVSEEGSIDIPYLIAGSSYELKVMEGLGVSGSWWSAPFQAAPGPQRMEAYLPGRFSASFVLHSTGGEISSGATLTFIQAGGASSGVLAIARLAPGQVEASVLLPPGDFRVEVSPRVDRSTEWPGTTLTETLSMPGHDTSFTVSIP